MSPASLNHPLASLLSDATALIDGLMQPTPYGEYAGYFNATLVYVDSNESGADHPGMPVDTAFDAMFNCAGQPQLICVDVSTTTVWHTTVPT